MGTLFAFVLVECDVLTVAEHIPCEDVACGRLINGGGVGGVAKEGAFGVADEFHVFRLTETGCVVGAFKHYDFVQSEKLRQHVGVDDSGVGGAAHVLHALDDVAVVAEGVVSLYAEGELVRGAATGQFDVLLPLIEEVNGVKVRVAEFQELLAAGRGRYAFPLVSPHASLEEVVRKEDVLMEEHLLGSETHLCSAGVCHAGGVSALVVEGSDLVDADDDLVDFALVGVVGRSHHGGLHLAEGGLASHVVAGEVSLAEFVVVACGLRYGADREDFRCHEIRRVGEKRHREVGQVVVRLPSFGDGCLNSSVVVLGVHSLFLLIRSRRQRISTWTMRCRT